MSSNNRAATEAACIVGRQRINEMQERACERDDVAREFLGQHPHELGLQAIYDTMALAFGVVFLQMEVERQEVGQRLGAIEAKLVEVLERLRRLEASVHGGQMEQ